MRWGRAFGFNRWANRLHFSGIVLSPTSVDNPVYKSVELHFGEARKQDADDVAYFLSIDEAVFSCPKILWEFHEMYGFACKARLEEKILFAGHREMS